MAIEKYYKLSDSYEILQVDYRHLAIDINGFVSEKIKAEANNTLVLCLRALDAKKLHSICALSFTRSS